MNKEKIIAVVGAPRSGKTFLVSKLAAALGFHPFLEGHDDTFPKFIEDDLKNGDNNLRTILWFRNRQLTQMSEALELKKIGQGAVLDTFWIDKQVYADVFLNGHDKDVINELIKIDLKTLHWPDIIIYLKNNEEGTRKFVKLGGRDFDSSDSYQKTISLLREKYENIFSLVPSTTTLVILERSGMDFERKEDMDKLLKMVCC